MMTIMRKRARNNSKQNDEAPMKLITFTVSYQRNRSMSPALLPVSNIGLESMLVD